MFEFAVDERPPGRGDRATVDMLDESFSEAFYRGLDDELSWRLDDSEPRWIPDRVPAPWNSGDDDLTPAPTYGTCEPSGWSAWELDTGTTDPASLDDATLIEAIIGFDRITSWAGARQARLLAEFARRRPRDPVPNEDRTSVGSTFAPDEVGVALHLARGTAAARIGLADRLLQVLPDTHAAWESGRIDLLKVRAVDDATHVLSDENAGKVEARVLPRAAEQTLGQLRAALARAVIAVDPAGAAERHQAARRDRRVCVGQESDGMASLWALLSAPDAAGAYTWLTRLARGLGDDPRTMDARRADLLVALLTGNLVTDADIAHTDDNPGTGTGTGTTGTGTGTTETSIHGTRGTDDRGTDDRSTDDSRIDDRSTDDSRIDDPEVAGRGRKQVLRPVTPGKALVQIVMNYSTLIGADDAPADLVGEGPIPATLAREIAADAVWRRLVTDPLSGVLLDHGRTTYHPPAALADHVRSRDQVCRFPGCRRRSADAELDHIAPWADGGGTSAVNLQALCPHHHRLKTRTRWRIETHPDGRLTWITPTGHRHTTAPHDFRSEPLAASTSASPNPLARAPRATADPDPGAGAGRDPDPGSGSDPDPGSGPDPGPDLGSGSGSGCRSYSDPDPAPF